MSRGSGAGWDHFGNNKQLSEEDLAAIFTQQQLDAFRNDPIYQAANEQGNFVDDINDATFEDFADMKDFITDSIYATDNGGGSDFSAKLGGGYDRPEVFERNPIDDAYPSYVDVSPFFKEWTPPRMYTEPGDIQMPEVLDQYNSTKRDVNRVAPRYLPLNQLPVVDDTDEEVQASRMVGHGEEGYPINYEDSGMLGGLDDMQPAHGNQWKEVYGKSSFTEMVKGKLKPTNFAKKALEQIGMKGSDSGYAALDKWMQIAQKDPSWEGASGFDLNSSADLDKFKDITKKYNFTLPEGPTW